MNARFWLLIVIAALFGPGRARADVALDPDANGAVVLFHLDGADIVRARCVTPTRFDRANCAGADARGPAGAVLDRVGQVLATELEPLRARLEDLTARVQRTDAKLFELLAADVPAGDTAAAQQEIAQIAARETALRAGMQPLQDQLARIQQAMVGAPDDADLRAQAAVVVQSLAQKALAADAAHAELEGKRAAYVARFGDAAATGDFPDLLVARSELAAQLKTARDAFRAKIEEQAALARLFALIRDEGMTYELLSGSNAFARVRAAAVLMNHSLNLQGLQVRVAAAAGRWSCHRGPSWARFLATVSMQVRDLASETAAAMVSITDLTATTYDVVGTPNTTGPIAYAGSMGCDLYAQPESRDRCRLHLDPFNLYGGIALPGTRLRVGYAGSLQFAYDTSEFDCGKDRP